MTFEEKGAYMELLMMQFNRGHMTTHMVGQVIGHMGGQVGGQLWDKIKDKFETDDQGKFFNRRLDDEIKKRQTFVKSRYNNLEGTNQYTKKQKKQPGHMRGHMTSHMENENVNRNVSDSEDRRGESPERGEEPITVQDFITRIIEQFIEATGGEYEIVSPGKEREAAGKLARIYKQRHPGSGTETALADLRAYFDRCVHIEDPWLRDHMSLPIIISKFNEINRILKNGKSKGTGVTDSDLAELMARKHGVDAPTTDR